MGLITLGKKNGGVPVVFRAITLKQGPRRYPGADDIQKKRSLLTHSVQKYVFRAFGAKLHTAGKSRFFRCLCAISETGRTYRNTVPTGVWLKSTRPSYMRVYPMPNQPQAGQTNRRPGLFGFFWHAHAPTARPIRAPCRFCRRERDSREFRSRRRCQMRGVGGFIAQFTIISDDAQRRRCQRPAASPLGLWFWKC